jgi:hypothetical protein
MSFLTRWLSTHPRNRTGTKADRILGNSVEYPSSDGSAGRIQLVVGLDFGTAFTKVVIAEKRRGYAVPFDGLVSEGSSPYLLPGILAIGEGQRVYLGEHQGAKYIDDLKMRILSRNTGAGAADMVTAFLALVLQRSREWFLNTYRDVYKSYKLDWYVNVGMPTEHYHSDDLVKFYRQIARAAWQASTLPEPLDIHVVSNCLVRGSGGITESAIGLFPEFVAQINGYVHSPLCRRDLHLLVDIGAGTVDVAVFNVHKSEGEDVFPIFAKSVEYNGSHFLERYRIEHSNAKATNEFGITDWRPDSEVAKILGLSVAELKAIDSQFINAVRDQIRRDVGIARKRYPESENWTEGLPFFLCGGGAKIEVYARLADRMQRDRFPSRLRRMQLPMPENLVADGLDEGSYDRLSVAYGLSFDPLNIGEIIRSNEFDDEPVPSCGPTLCPKCGGSGGAMANSCLFCAGRGWLS